MFLIFLIHIPTFSDQKKKIAPTSIMYFELPTSMIQYKTNVFVQLIVLLLDKVYEIMKPSECPFFISDS